MESTLWHELIPQLELGGVARMIAEHSVLAPGSAVPAPDGQVRLILDQAHDTLLSDAQAQVIERALAEQLGQPIKLNIETGEIEQETPAVRRARLDSERQRDAQNMLESDVTVRSLLSEFGGRLDDVQPVESAQLTGSRQSGGARK